MQCMLRMQQTRCGLRQLSSMHIVWSKAAMAFARVRGDRGTWKREPEEHHKSRASRAAGGRLVLG